MIVLLILMLLLLAPALWAYIYIWRGLNRRVIAAVKVVDPIITLGPYAMGAWAALTASKTQSRSTAMEDRQK